MDFDGCSDVSKRRIITVNENKMKFCIYNDGCIKVRVVKVDGCLINDHRQRCDYLFEVNNPVIKVIYVELKGRDVEKACQQLGATIGYCKEFHSSVQRICYIVASRVPRSGPKVQVLKKRFQNKFGVMLSVYTRIAEVVI